MKGNVLLPNFNGTLDGYSGYRGNRWTDGTSLMSDLRLHYTDCWYACTVPQNASGNVMCYQPSVCVQAAIYLMRTVTALLNNLH